MNVQSIESWLAATAVSSSRNHSRRQQPALCLGLAFVLVSPAPQRGGSIRRLATRHVRDRPFHAVDPHD